MSDPKAPALPPASYVNFLRVGSDPSQFFLTFGQVAQPEQAAAHLVASLVTTPAHAKAMLRALTESLEKHEARFGEIAEPAAETGTSGPRGGSTNKSAKASAPPTERKRSAANG